MADSPWPVIQAERDALAADLDDLTGDGVAQLRARVGAGAPGA